MRGTGAESLVVVMKSLSWRWSEGATSGGLVRVQLDCPGGDTDEDTTMCQPTGGSPDGSGMSREAHVPFYEGLGVQFPRPTHRALGLIRFRGHVPKGGYDVHDAQDDEVPATTPAV